MTTMPRGFSVLIFVIALTGCHTATYKSTTTDAQGRSTTCEVTGRTGLLRGLYAKQAFEECMTAAKEPAAK